MKVQVGGVGFVVFIGVGSLGTSAPRVSASGQITR
jgi:hypothetical protein